MAKIPFDIVGFDLDGTLLDTSGELAASLNHTLALAGRRTFAVDDIYPMIGRGLAHLLNSGLDQSGGTSPELLERWLPVLMDHYERHLGEDSRLYPGLAGALDGLHAQGVTLAVVTNKIERLAVLLLERMGIAERFCCIIGGDTMGAGKAKPHRAPLDEMIRRCGDATGQARAVFIGDGPADTGAARAAGIASVAVSFGFRTGPVAELGADAVIEHYDELLSALITLGQAGKARNGEQAPTGQSSR